MMGLSGEMISIKDWNSTPGYAYAVIIISALGMLVYTNFLKSKFTRMNQALYFREELYRTLCGSIDDIFVIFSPCKRLIEYVSPNLERIYGISDISMKRDPGLFYNNMDAEGMKKTAQIFTEASIISNFELEFEYIHPKTGGTIPSIMHVYPVVKNKLVTRYIISIRNLTKEKQAHKALMDALIEARKSNEAKKELLSHVSHEIKAPANAVIALADRAAASLEDIKSCSLYLEKLQEASINLLELIDNILDMSRLDANKLIINREPFYLGDFLNSYHYMISSQAKQKQLDFDILTDFDHGYLYGDTFRLRQVLDNCISNSLKFTPQRGNIKLDVSEIGLYGNIAMYRFIIADNGKGMNEEYAGRIFNPFEQEDGSIAEKYGGSGLGMYITKNIVTLMEGDIHVSSKPGAGTVVTIHLPFDIVSERQD